MANDEVHTPMVHYVCEVCALSATIVVTPVGELAWLDHMESHADPSLYKAWTWTVQRLF